MPNNGLSIKKALKFPLREKNVLLSLSLFKMRPRISIWVLVRLLVRPLHWSVHPSVGSFVRDGFVKFAEIIKKKSSKCSLGYFSILIPLQQALSVGRSVRWLVNARCFRQNWVKYGYKINHSKMKRKINKKKTKKKSPKDASLTTRSFSVISRLPHLNGTNVSTRKLQIQCRNVFRGKVPSSRWD